MNETKKIVYVIEDFSVCGGVERIISEKANILHSKYGHEVTIISVYKDDRPVIYALNENVKTVFLNVPMAKKSSNGAMMAWNRIKTLIKAAAMLNKTIKRINPDIIFFATTLSALLLPLCRTKAKKIYESHLARLFNPYNTFFSIMERSADMIVCLTEGDAKEYKHAKKVKIIPNFIKKPSSYVKNYGEKKAVAVGRLEKQKGFDILIDIWKDIKKEHSDWQLHIYGEGPLEQELQHQINSSGLTGNVILCGRCRNMIEKYTEYSLHIMTSRYEGQPMTLIEAQACGLPSVVFDFKYGARNIINNKTNGIIVAQNDKKEFVRALNILINNEDLRKSYGENAAMLSDKFFVDKIMPSWQKLVDEL